MKRHVNLGGYTTYECFQADAPPIPYRLLTTTQHLLTDIIPAPRTPAPLPPPPSSTTLLALLAALPRSIPPPPPPPPPDAPDAAAAAAVARFAAVDASKFCIRVFGTPAGGAALSPPPPAPPPPPPPLVARLAPSPAAPPSVPSPEAEVSLAVMVAGSDKTDGAARPSAPVAPVAAPFESPFPTLPPLLPPPPPAPPALPDAVEVLCCTGAPRAVVDAAGLLFFELECGCGRTGKGKGRAGGVEQRTNRGIGRKKPRFTQVSNTYIHTTMLPRNSQTVVRCFGLAPGS